MSTASGNPLELEFRANRAFSGMFGVPVVGGSGSIATDGTDKVQALVGGSVYLLGAVTADVFVAIGAVGESSGAGASSLTAANRMRLRFAATNPTIITVPPAGATLHVTQASAPGILEFTRMDDVG